MDISVNFSDKITLKEAYSKFQGEPPTEIPFLIWLLENPDSPIALPGKIYLREHDYLHILLNCNLSPKEEAFVIGFTMGNDPDTNGFYLSLFKFFARFLYPKKYRFSVEALQAFDDGVIYGRERPVTQVNKLLMDEWLDDTLEEIREFLGIELQEIDKLIST